MERSPSGDELTIPLTAFREGDDAVPEAFSNPQDGLNFYQTLFSLLNVFIGVGLLSIPYGVRQGGWVSLLALLITSTLFAASAQIIVKAFGLLDPATPKSYGNLGRSAAGPAGAIVVVFFSVAELFGGACVQAVVIQQQILVLLPKKDIHLLGGSGDGGGGGNGGGAFSLTSSGAPGLVISPDKLAGAIGVALLLGPVAFGGFRRLAALSTAGTVSTGLVPVLLLSLVGLDPHRRQLPQPPPPHVLYRPTLASSIGMFAMACSGHSTLPALRSAMRRPRDFPRVVAFGFSTIASVYLLVGAAGYWYYGDAVTPVVSVDVAATGAYRPHPSVPGVLDLLVLVACVARVPTLILILQNIALDSVAVRKLTGGLTPRPGLLSASRLAVFALIALVSYLARDNLGPLVGLLGSVCSLTLSLLLPSSFYLRLAWPRLGPASRSALAFVAVVSLAAVAQGAAQGIAAFRAP